MTGGPFLHAAGGGLGPSARAFDILVLPSDDPIDGLILVLKKRALCGFWAYSILLYPI